jgi:hypothetical protein
MKRSPPFRQRDLSRVVHALKAAGLVSDRVEVGKDGTFALIPMRHLGGGKKSATGSSPTRQ